MFPRRLFVAMLLLCLAPDEARAQQFDYGSVRLLQTGEKSGALFFELHSPWKISWRKNRVNVFPTELRWRANTSSLLWPFPKAFDLFGVRSYGYEGRTALPFTTRAPILQGEPVDVRFAACAQVCLPIETTLTVELPTEQERLVVASHLQQVPREGGREGKQTTELQLTYLPINSSDDRLASEEGKQGQQGEQSVLLQGRLSSGLSSGQTNGQTNEQSWRNPRLIVERAATEQGGLFEVTSLKGSRNLRFEAAGTLPRDAGQSSVRVTLVADNLSPLTLLATPRLAPSPYGFSRTQATTSLPLSVSFSLLGLLSLAFLGGLVLNAMPCVFPVFAVKIASLARADAQDRKERQRRKTASNTSSRLQSSKLQRALLANALGMMLAFLLLASVLVLAKSGGEKLGWGFQFHWPVFSGSLAALLLLLACDGWRIAALPFPAYSETFSSEAEASPTRAKEWSSECATGVLLTWLATPCAAPVLGSALSAAVVQQPPVVFLMFAFMGAGMAAPLLLAAAYPQRVAKLLPPPGAWSEALRKTLAVAIFAASLWLFAVFAKQLSFTAACILAATTLLVVFVLRKKQQTSARKSPQPLSPAKPQARHASLRPSFASARALPLVLLLTSPVLVAVLLSLAKPPLQEATSLSPRWQSLGWQPFAPERIPDLLASEHLVVVNVTADWCLSCKVLEQRVYKTAAVRERLEQLHPLTLMRADWTSHDARIATFMREHRRYAIPFTALFASEDEVLILPELYGKQTFLDALAYAESVRYRQTHDRANKP